MPERINGYHVGFYEELDRRFKNTSFQQFTPSTGFSDARVNPITGRDVLMNTARSQRTFQFLDDLSDSPQKKPTSVEKCHFCQGNTPSTLFYIGEADSREGGRAYVCNEDHSVGAANGHFAQLKINIEVQKYGRRITSVGDLNAYYRMLGQSKDLVKSDMDENHWLCRSFLNLTPSFPILPETCILIAAHPEYHRLYLDEFPPRVVSSVVEAWKVWEGYVKWWNRENSDWVTKNGELRAFPFVNGGKRPEAGQTMFCFHSQIYITKIPGRFKDIERIKDSDGCSICSILNRNVSSSSERSLEVYHNDTMVLCMHPAPLRNFGMLAMPRVNGDTCISDVNGLRNSDVADVLQRAISIYRRLLGRVPAYNISLRSGPEVGHLHIQVVPKTETNILAGYEDLTNKIVITQDPVETAETLRRRYA